MYKLTVVRTGSTYIHTSEHDSIQEAVEELSGRVLMRITKRQADKIAGDVRLYNDCQWKHKNFSMEIEKSN